MLAEVAAAAVEPPDMSVVLLVDQERERGARCLRSVLAQSIVDRLEVLLVDLAGPDAGPLAGSDHPRVRVLRPPATASFGELHAEGVLRARAPIVAFLEEHCVALPGWAEAMVRAHRGPAAAVGGERHNPAPQRSLAQFIHLLDNGPWSAPAVEQTTKMLPAGNVAYKWDVLMRYRDRLSLYFQSEGLLQAKMIEDGLTFRVEPAAKYQHEYDDSLAELVARWFWQGYAIGAARAELLGGTRRRRARHLWRWLKGVAFPPVVLVRLIAARSPGRTRLVLSKVHVALLYPMSHVSGDVAGTLLGRQGRDERVRHRLLNGRRAARGAQ